MTIKGPISLSVAVERWPIAGRFAISREAKTEATVVVVELGAGGKRGRGECVPYTRYGETVDGVAAAIRALSGKLTTRAALQSQMPPGAARNALDCAFWDLEAKVAGKPVHEFARLSAPRAVTTAYTISLGAPDEMAAATAKAAARPLLKIKLGGDADPARIAAVRKAAPKSALIVDANEGWSDSNLAANLAACAEAGVVFIEQPLPEGKDSALAKIKRPIPVCADESTHSREGLAALRDRYDAVNIKLDKAGGLTEALAMVEEAEELGFVVMAGSMVGTSLAVAPAMLIAQHAHFVDLDGPLLLAKDREPGLRFDGSKIFPPTPEVWG
jgi:L-alanine-DL-glutamate epimerase-like enolase superfamily enzyme